VMIKQLVITKQLKLYFNNSSRIPTQLWTPVQCNSYRALKISNFIRGFLNKDSVIS
jgi:redox-regulated HSP33 family molecular chaperone